MDHDVSNCMVLQVGFASFFDQYVFCLLVLGIVILCTLFGCMLHVYQCNLDTNKQFVHLADTTACMILFQQLIEHWGGGVCCR